MRVLLFACLIAPAVHAQTIECPKFYPWQDTPLAEVPYQHKGKGIVAKAALTGASMYIGEVGGQGELMGDGRKVKGGWDPSSDSMPSRGGWSAATARPATSRGGSNSTARPHTARCGSATAGATR